ncbi:MAG TPA: hypothetical protein DDW33_03345 [Ktedonobacter sp.]|jgi:hypothetical protein|nr:hypothetical protein [Ktedonobacter sp.]HAT44617.1 hypothetical protein [Ktedonobacter sp.]HBE24705.1 hypothetical protein [Ktedonobacter sp.]HCJ36424.1 hypothetical protein [Ktedonobacter sp.]HCP73553.1 hypothetical protein [Ktedonobacter sp.]
MAKTATAKTQISSATVNRVTNKVTHEVSYLVKSDSSEQYYQVRWDNNQMMCNCAATRPCKHMRAVNEVLAERRARLAEKIGGEMPAIISEMQREEDRVTMPNGTQRIASQINSACLDSLDKINEAYAEADAKWQAKQEDWKESSKFGTQSVQKTEVAPSGRLVPMR